MASFDSVSRAPAHEPTATTAPDITPDTAPKADIPAPDTSPAEVAEVKKETNEAVKEVLKAEKTDGEKPSPKETEKKDTEKKKTGLIGTVGWGIAGGVKNVYDAGKTVVKDTGGMIGSIYTANETLRTRAEEKKAKRREEKEQIKEIKKARNSILLKSAKVGLIDNTFVTDAGVAPWVVTLAGKALNEFVTFPTRSAFGAYRGLIQGKWPLDKEGEKEFNPSWGAKIGAGVGITARVITAPIWWPVKKIGQSFGWLGKKIAWIGKK